MTQRLQARRERVSLDLAKREELYGEFIELVASDEVLREAEEVFANLLKWYSNPVQEIRAVMEQAARREVADPIQPFAQSCRRERGYLLRQPWLDDDHDQGDRDQRRDDRLERRLGQHQQQDRADQPAE